MPNKWVNPPLRIVTEDEFPNVDAVPYGMTPPTSPNPTSFATMKKQVKKKNPTKKPKKERIADKSVSLAERVGIRNH